MKLRNTFIKDEVMLKLSSPQGLAVICMMMLSLLAIRAAPTQGAELPTSINFDEDTPGEPPVTGGEGQPSNLVVPAGSTILVRSEANGITTQPVEVTVDTFSKFVSVNVDFEPVLEGVLRIEVTVAFDRLFDGFFLQTAVPTAVASRLVVTSDGEIQDFADRMTLGNYSPNQPFRIRMDIDMSLKRWSVAVDNEIDGFEDDVVVSGLRFVNEPDNVPGVGELLASLDVFPTADAGPASVAYDDVTIAITSKFDHFKCYLARGERFRSEHVFLEDQFGGSESEVRGPVSFCNPVDKNGEGINDPETRLACYRIVGQRGGSHFGTRELPVENQFGEDTLQVGRAQTLCVPSREVEFDEESDVDDSDGAP